MHPDLRRRLAAEFCGTTLLLATVVGSGIQALMLADGSVGLALLCNAVATAAVLIVLITLLGPICGAHFNPAVTLAFLTRGEISRPEAALYVLVQIAGAAAGTLLAHAMFGEPLWQISAQARSGASLWLSELVAAFGLVAAILLALRHCPQAIAWIVGLYIMAAHWFTASTSFANPAVTLARAFTDTFAGIRPEHAPAFVLAQLLGALLATLAVGWLLRAPGDIPTSLEKRSRTTSQP